MQGQTHFTQKELVTEAIRRAKEDPAWAAAEKAAKLDAFEPILSMRYIIERAVIPLALAMGI